MSPEDEQNIPSNAIIQRSFTSLTCDSKTDPAPDLNSFPERWPDDASRPSKRRCKSPQAGEVFCSPRYGKPCSTKDLGLPHPAQTSEQDSSKAETKLDASDRTSAQQALGGVLTARKVTCERFPDRNVGIRYRVELSTNFKVPSFHECPEWAKPLMFAEQQAGFSEAWLCSIFRFLPTDLAVALRGAVLSQMIIEKYEQVLEEKKFEKSLEYVEQVLSTRLRDTIQQPEPWLYDRFGNNDDELLVFDRAGTAITRETFVPSSRRRTEYYANPEMCRLAGLPIDELLARVAAANLPECSSQLDHLYTMVEGLLSSRDDAYIEVIRWSWPGRPAVLIERTTRNIFNVQGLRWQRHAFHRELPPAEYDARCAAADAAAADAAAAAHGGGRTGPGGLGGLRRAVGDGRGGAALLAEAAADQQRETIRDLAGTAEGRRTLSRLAEEVLRRCDGRTRAARRIVATCPEVEAWARGRLGARWQPDSDSSCAPAGEK